MVTGGKTLIAILISFACIYVYEWWCKYLTKRNISKKTLIDPKFLI